MFVTESEREPVLGTRWRWRAMGTPPALAILLIFSGAHAEPIVGEAHLAEENLPRRCGSCHRGHGTPDTPMLTTGGAEACMRCHGGVAEDALADISPAARSRLRNIRSDFDKGYRHPIETARYHQRHEALPERDSATPRHVSCLDCHEAHRPLRPSIEGPEGSTQPRAATMRDHTYEYEVCYRCHGDSANLPAESRNVRLDFDLGQASMHPVEGPGHGREVPSLRPPYTETSVIGCTDCHGGDDAAGARAPHGSRYPGLLVANYSTRDGSGESDFEYRLCYRCHDRQKIFANERFPQHREHILGSLNNSPTTCYTCHDSHGSRDYPHLLRFNDVVVDRVFSSLDSGATYRASMDQPGAFECYIVCHGLEHNPGRYCQIGGNCDTGSLCWLPGHLPSGATKFAECAGSSLQPSSLPLQPSPFDQDLGSDPFAQPPPL